MPDPADLARRHLAALTCLGLGGLAAATAAAQPQESEALAACAAIGAATDRLACYDRLAGRALPEILPPAQTPLPVAEPEGSGLQAGPGGDTVDPGALASDSMLQPRATAPLEAPGLRIERPSLLSAYWELDARDKRGTFNLLGYRTNFVLPVHYTTRINRSPSSPTQQAVPQPDYRNIEAKFQLSLRTKVLQDFGLPGADLWMGFTQQSLWQIYNSTDSKPFRNTDYEPELMYVVPIPERMRALPAGWQWRMVQASLIHQSNGQSDPMSRSWNRLQFGTAFERGNWALSARLLHRLPESDDDDNNPDLLSYRGRWELQADWSSGRHTAGLLYRSTVRDVSLGAIQFDWSYPVFADEPNGVRWYLQLFHGYGETLTDYNFRQTSLGLGISFLQF